MLGVVLMCLIGCLPSSVKVKRKEDLNHVCILECVAVPGTEQELYPTGREKPLEVLPGV